MTADRIIGCPHQEASMSAQNKKRKDPTAPRRRLATGSPATSSTSKARGVRPVPGGPVPIPYPNPRKR
jgi:hypothetical protein